MKISGIKIKAFLKNNSQSVILYSILLFFNLTVLIYKITKSGYSLFSKRAFIAYLIFIIISILILLILYKAKTRAWKIEKIFLTCGIVLGVFYSFMLPVGAPPDEPAHFWRAYELSEGRLLTETDGEGNTGIYMPDNLQKIITADYALNANGYQSIIDNFSTRASDNYILDSTPAESYTPFNYLPQIIGIWIGKILNLPLIPIVYICRLLNMVFCIFVIYLCIKNTPILKKAIFLIALFPMTMQLFSSVSADGSIICAGIAIISFVIYSRTDMKRKINKWDCLLLLIACITLVLTKPVYAPLCLSLFWIPKERFSTNRVKIIEILSLGAITLLLLFLRITLIQTNLNQIDEFGHNPSEQINFILFNPLSFIAILFKNSILYPEQYINGLIGQRIEWFSIDLFAPYIITFFLFFAFLCTENEIKITRGLRIFILCIFSSIVLLIFTTMFITWTPSNSTTIEGVQGRYFLPIILLIPLFCLPSKKIKKRQIIKTNYLYIFTALANTYALIIIFCSHI